MPRSLVRRTARIAPLVLAGLVAGCGTGGPPTPAPAVPAGPTPEPSAAASAAPATQPGDPTPVPTAALSEPPVALLSGEAQPGEPAVGALGSYTWGNEGSDAPWIVPSTGGRAAAAAPLTVTFEPSAGPASWIARWAPVVADGAGNIASASEGSGDVVLAAPDAAGAWSLQLEARFGAGRSATWYWRVDVP